MPAGYLTTHVLDTARGVPVRGMRIELFRVEHSARVPLRSALTDGDGRTERPILPKDEFAAGVYELVFHAGAYLSAQEGRAVVKGAPAVPRFLDLIPIRFGIEDVDSHYHVPLLLSPFGYSTYRGS